MADSTTLATIGRLALPTIKDDFKEGVGAPLDSTGAGVALGQRRPKGFAFTIRILPFNVSAGVDPLLLADRMRRQLRSMLQNDRLRGQGLYFAFAADPELNGWVMIGNGQLGYADGNVVVGNFTVTLDEIYRVATLWTHRPGLRLSIADRRLASTPRDILEQVFSTDFAGLPAVSVAYLPPGISDIPAMSSGSPAQLGFWLGQNGTTFSVINAADGDTVSFERPEASRNAGDVVVYDRRGVFQSIGSSTGAGALWEEVYGLDWPWNWWTAGQPQDTPVLDNGRCRVRYEAASGLPGLKVDVWNGTFWAEQGKITIQRRAAPAFPSDDMWIAAGLVSYTPERAVMRVVLGCSTDPRGREIVYVTLQRGWSGPRVEVYPGVQNSGTPAGAAISWSRQGYETAACAVKLDGVGGPARTIEFVNSTTFGGGGYIGAGNFVGENHWSLLAAGAAFTTIGTVLQASAFAYVTTISFGYGPGASATSTVQCGIEAPGKYIGVQFGFYPQDSAQSLEAEAIRNLASGTATQVADAAASGGQCVKETQTSNAANTLFAGTTLPRGATMRVIARVKVDSGATGSFQAGSDLNVSAIAATSSTAWVDLDLGNLTIGASGNVVVDGWRSAGSSGAVYIDLVWQAKLQDRASTNIPWDGAQDLAQAVLMDTRAVQVQVER